MGRNFNKGGKSFRERERDKRRARVYRTRSREDRKEMMEALKHFQPSNASDSSAPIFPAEVVVNKPSFWRRILAVIGISRGSQA